jgi:hypothetical protein
VLEELPEHVVDAVVVIVESVIYAKSVRNNDFITIASGSSPLSG